MDTRQAEYAVAVAEELSFTRAAVRVHAVQSTVSAGIRALETELGVVLFERSQRGVRITSAGEAVIPALRDFLAAQARVKAAADPREGLRGELRVGAFANVSYLAVPQAIQAFRQAHPGVDLRLRAVPGGSGALATAVKRGELDLSLFGLPAATATGWGLSVTGLARSRYQVLLPPGHQLRGRSEVRLDELRGERFVDAPEGFGNRDVLDAALRPTGFPRDVVVEVMDTSAIAVFVGLGLGVAVLPEVLIPPDGRIESVPLTGPAVEWELNVVTRERPSEAAQALLDHLVAAYAARAD